MAQPLRILAAGVWYRAISRGNRRESHDQRNADRRRSLGLAADLRSCVAEVHAFVPIDNGYHLVVRTWQPNLSKAMRSLHVSYGGRFNRAHRLCARSMSGGKYGAAEHEAVRGSASGGA